MNLNLNADLGESFGAWEMRGDRAMLGIVNSANIACGYHAGDPWVMINTVRLAKEKGVSIGAHPAFPDLQGFGRRRMDIPPHELEAMIIYQIGALSACARAEGAFVTHVKPHGALSNLACVDETIANAVARAVYRLDPTLILLAPAASEMVRAGEAMGLSVIEEIFADRAYLDDGSLVPRSHPEAMIIGAEASLKHVLRMVEAQAIVSIHGKRIPIKPQSICVHGDNAEASAVASAIRAGLLNAGYQFKSLPEMANKDIKK